MYGQTFAIVFSLTQILNSTFWQQPTCSGKYSNNSLHCPVNILKENTYSYFLEIISNQDELNYNLEFSLIFIIIIITIIMSMAFRAWY